MPKKTKSKIQRKQKSEEATNRTAKAAIENEPPHNDTKVNRQTINTNVEIAKGSLDDFSQTDQPPLDRV